MRRLAIGMLVLGLLLAPAARADGREVSQAELDMLAKVTWGEARGCSEDEWRLVAWTVFNRTDHEDFPNTVTEVITDEGQFHGWSKDNPVDPDIWRVVAEEAVRWVAGYDCCTLAPYASEPGYLFFSATDEHNYFRGEY